MRWAKIEGNITGKIVAICIVSFIIAAISTALGDIFSLPAYVAGISPSAVDWAHPALDVLFVVMVGAFATYLVSRLVGVRARIEAELKFNTELLDAATDSIFVYRPDGSFIYCNETGYTSRGYSKEELMAMNRRDLAVPEYAKVFDARLKEIIDKGESTFESIHLRKNGTTMPVEIHARRISVNREDMVLSICRDITERKRAEEQSRLQQARELNRQATIAGMAAGIAHEVNNPLNIITNYAELVLENPRSENVAELAGVIKRNAQRASAILDKLLTFARQRSPKRVIVSINDIIETTLVLCAHQLQRNNIKVSTMLDPNLPDIVADADQMQQVFLNLIMNAETAMKQAHGAGMLQIRVEKAKSNILISFKDDGPGISKENLARLFDPFFTTREVGEGTGLGLSVCHGIVAEHSGKIWAESESGKGATLFIELPISSS